MADGVRRAEAHHLDKFRRNRSIVQSVVVIFYDFSIFKDGGSLPSWILALNWTTREEYLTICITVQNLVAIDAVVSIIGL